MVWLQENREAIKRKHPGSSVAEVAKRAGEMWKTITAEEKAVSTECMVCHIVRDFVSLSAYQGKKFFIDDLKYSRDLVM